MENTVKITKAMVLTAIEGYFVGMEADEIVDGDVTVADVLEYAAKTKEQLATKAAKAKEKAAEKKVEGDELRDAVQAALTDEFEPIADIAARVEGEDVTVAKVTQRLTALVKAGLAEKAEIKVSAEGEKTRKIMGYKAVAVADADAEAEVVDAE